MTTAVTVLHIVAMEIYRVAQKKWTAMQSVNVIYVNCCSTMISFL